MSGKYGGKFGRTKYASMRASGEDDARKGGTGKKILNRKPLNGNFIAQRQHGDGADYASVQVQQQKDQDALEAQLGFPMFKEGEKRLGWLLNYTTALHEDRDAGQVQSAVDCYFQCQDGSMFKARLPYAPYFYLGTKEGCERDVEAWLRRKFEGRLKDVEVVTREDLDLKNHLSGLKRQLLKVSTWTVSQLMDVRREVMPLVRRNTARAAAADVFAALQAPTQDGRGKGAAALRDVAEALTDLREYDVPYHVRYAIDTDLRAGHWYDVAVVEGATTATHRPDLLQRAEPVVCAFDIECTKLPLQFPNAEYDQVFMISYMLDRKGFLIVNREVVGADIQDFEYTPKPEFEGPFTVINAPDEATLLRSWFDHMRAVNPAIYVTYNGDFFDWPFVATRAEKHGLDTYAQLGFRVNKNSGEWLSRSAVHMDCLHWVNRDSYLPQGSRGLKAVTKAKLGYDPVEVAPEDMVRLAGETPQAMASYSVSDAVATYYLYMTYIHPFIFSLATIIPLPPDEVLRKGSGTLCEQLLMVQAYKGNIVCPNKHTSAGEVMFKGHLLDSETYIGGKVEALESGVFRSDLPVSFRTTPAAYQSLLDNLDRDLGYALRHDAKWDPGDVGNYAEVRAAIAARLEALRDAPNREEPPLIYHLDVAAMYPNIILTNRLQPSAIVGDEDCAACDFNRPGKTCLRPMEWVWRGEHFTCTRAEYAHIKRQLQSELFPPSGAGAAGADDGGGAGGGDGGGGAGSSGGGGGGAGGSGAVAGGGAAGGAGVMRVWDDLAPEEKAKLLKDRLKKYCQKVYKRVLDKPVQERRTAGVCQRENAFYVDTVRAFRDRRYEYKGLNKKWKGQLEAAKAAGDALAAARAADMVVLYDSLQLAHKCILNSFYGYVMRKGARWYSMEMAGVVTHTGAAIIQSACRLVEQLGKPLELDTDGIWCVLPSTFPEDYAFAHAPSGRTFKISYPCVMLNVLVAEHNTNDQYATLVDPATHAYATSSEMSIEFEVDGPYRAMILPASKEEGKLIKKRYAVFNNDGTLAELKGFEIKRRGELKLIKVFQAEVFERFLAGGSLRECYEAVGAVANRWIDMLETQGVDLSDEELLELISEATTMSKAVEEYEGRKSCAITTARRLAAFLGDERLRDKGLACQYIIARRPEGAPTSERAVPVQIFSAEPSVARSWLRKWCGDIGSAPATRVPDPRDILDWEYYLTRLGGTVQKIITIPAAMQHVPNPVPRVKHPDWLHKRVRERDSRSKQMTLDTLFRGQHLRQQQRREHEQEQRREAAPGGRGEAGPAPEASEEGGEAPGGGEGVGRQTALMDLEDIGAGTSAGGAALRARVRRRARMVDSGGGDACAAAGGDACDAAGGDEDGAAADVRVRDQAAPPGAAAGGKRSAAEAAALAAPRPDRRSDYRAWVAWRKRSWREARLDHKRRRVEAAKARPEQEGSRPQAAAPTGNLGAFLRQQQAAALHTHWQLLQLSPDRGGEPGVFVAWALVEAGGGAALYQIRVRVPRRVYINSDAAPDDPTAAGLGEPVRVSLPHGDQPRHVYMLEMSEAEWQAHVGRLSMQLLGNRSVLAAYEDRTPLALTAALHTGCCARVAPGRGARKNLGDVFELTELQMRTTTECGYLTGAGPEGLGPLHYAGLFKSEDAAAPLGERRALYALLLPATRRCLLVVVTGRGGSAQRDVTTTLLERSWREAMEALGEQSHNTQEQVAGLSGVTFAVEYVARASDAPRLLQRALQDFAAALRGAPLLVAMQSAQPAVALQREVPRLADWPCVEVPPLAQDSTYPPLQWQQRAARRAVHRVAMLGGWLRERAALARYAHVPLADLGGDPCLAVADALYARALRSAGHLLWTVDPALPELAVDGAVDAPCALLQEPPDAELVRPGAYRTVCVELRVLHLAVAALDGGPLLAEAEGGSSLEALGTPGFRVLRGLVQAWLEDVARRHSGIADALLQNLYRWVSNPGSRLHDPPLHEALCRLMQKLFAVLVADLTRLGATIVAGSFGSIVLCTGKATLRDAVGYLRFLLSALKGGGGGGAHDHSELYRWLELEPARWWHTLLYRDAYNYGGVEATVSEALWAGGGAGGAAAGEEAEAEVAEIGAPGGPRLSYQWNLSEFLPPVLQEHLVVALTEFMYKPWAAAKAEAEAAAEEGAQAAEEGGEGAAGGGARAVGGSQAAAEARSSEAAQVAYLKGEMVGHWGNRLMSKVSAMSLDVLPGSTRPEHRFPQLAGSHLSEEELGTPALAFTLTLTHLLALDGALGKEVLLLRRRLLKLLQVSEFGPRAQFLEPCLPIRLRDVICSYCNACRDLDLCRDQELQRHQWGCPSCSQPYDQAWVEARLVAQLHGRLTAYVTQDVRCCKCRQVAEAHLQSCCEACGGALEATIPPDAMRKRLMVFSNCGRYHGFELLAELAATALADGRAPPPASAG